MTMRPCNTINTGAGDDTYTPVAGSTSAVNMGDDTDTYSIGGLNISANSTNVTNFEVLDITGGATIGVAFDNDSTLGDGRQYIDYRCTSSGRYY